MERRDFIKASLALAALLSVNRAGSLSAEGATKGAAEGTAQGAAGAGAGAKAKVCTAKTAAGAAAEALRKMLAPLGGIQTFVKKGNRVLLKPNFSFSNAPEAGSSTTPAVVRELAMMCREAGAGSVVVCDNTIKNARACLERTGIQAALKDLDGVKIVVPQKDPEFDEVEIPKGKVLKKTNLARELLQCDVYINVPTAKSHSATQVSFGLKGQMGLIQDRTSFHWRFDIDQAIADLATVAIADLTILDATRCLKTGGPGGPGKVVETGILACSTDPVALDAYGTTLVEWGDVPTKPQDVKHIVAAAAHGLGVADLAGIEIV
jgi:uncharacterized protein (DUF362 family)